MALPPFCPESHPNLRTPGAGVESTFLPTRVELDA